MNKRLLFVTVNLRVSNGITSFIMGNYDFLIEKGYSVDFLLIKKIESPYNDYVEKHGSKIYVYPHNNKYSIKNYHYAKQICSKRKYLMIHCNITGIYALWILLAAKRANINGRIHHAHGPKDTFSLKGRVRGGIFNSLCALFITDRIACSEYAGHSFYGSKKFDVIINGLDFDKYYFNSQKRKEIREELCISDRILVGTVGRQAEEKNPFFIVDILEELRKINEKYVLIWIGTGSMLNDVKAYIETKGLTDSVFMLGNRTNVNDYYAAMDCFLMPSKYEGLCLALLEAQVSGLICFASVSVPKETNITGNIKYYDLRLGSHAWAVKMDKERENFYGITKREQMKNLLCNCDYDLKHMNEKLLAVYIRVLQRSY